MYQLASLTRLICNTGIKCMPQVYMLSSNNGISRGPFLVFFVPGSGDLGKVSADISLLF